MDTAELITHTKRIADHLQQQVRARSEAAIRGALIEATEFLRVYAGPKTAFFSSLNALIGYEPTYAGTTALSILESFTRYLEAGLNDAVSPVRRAQLDVVSDFLDQARILLEKSGVHPAAPTVLIGATLEEFLRTWIEAKELPLGSRKPGLETYSQLLRDADLISKQDAKDILSWGGLRNHAAHGEWDQVSDKQRVQLMLEGVNLFMRKYES